MAENKYLKKNVIMVLRKSSMLGHVIQKEQLLVFFNNIVSIAKLQLSNIIFLPFIICFYQLLNTFNLL